MRAVRPLCLLPQVVMFDIMITDHCRVPLLLARLVSL